MFAQCLLLSLNRKTLKQRYIYSSDDLNIFYSRTICSQHMYESKVFIFILFLLANLYITCLNAFVKIFLLNNINLIVIVILLSNRILKKLNSLNKNTFIVNTPCCLITYKYKEHMWSLIITSVIVIWNVIKGVIAMWTIIIISLWCYCCVKWNYRC